MKQTCRKHCLSDLLRHVFNPQASSSLKSFHCFPSPALPCFGQCRALIEWCCHKPLSKVRQTMDDHPKSVKATFIDESKPPSSIITVKVKRNSANGFGMNFHINPDETLVLDILLGITNGNEAEALKLKLMWGAKQMDNFRRVREYFNVDGQVIIAFPRLLGGTASKKRKPTLTNLKEQPDALNTT